MSDGETLIMMMAHERRYAHMYIHVRYVCKCFLVSYAGIFTVIPTYSYVCVNCLHMIPKNLPFYYANPSDMCYR